MHRKPRRSVPLTVERLEPRLPLSGTGLAAISGDWNHDNTDSTGLYDPAAGVFYLRNSNSPGFADTSFRFGPTNSHDIAIAGDWNGDGTDTIGLYDPATGTFLIRNTNNTGPANLTFAFGPHTPNDQPIAGDWTHTGHDSVGIFDPASGMFYIKNALGAGPADEVFSLGLSGAKFSAIAGDWDGDHFDTVGLYDNTTGNFSLSNHLFAPAVDQTLSITGAPLNEQPLGGDWAALGKDSVGLYDPSTGMFSLRNTTTTGPADEVFFAVPGTTPALPAQPATMLTTADVDQLLQRAAAATASNDEIVAIVDRGGHILGVHTGGSLPFNMADTAKLVFAIDGAVAEARTAAFFANNTAPLTSRTIRDISQSTVTEREVNSSPDVTDPNSPLRGPGFVAPIGLGGHFPPEILRTPPVDLFAIEHTNRDSIVHPGLDGIKGTADDIPLPSRFNVPTAFVAQLGNDPPESYGIASGRLASAESRGIGTLPGGIPLFKNGVLVGGIGVFFPGPDGYASYEQGFIHGANQTEKQRTNASRVLEAEWIAFAAAGGSIGATPMFPGASIGTLGGVPRVPGFDLPFGRIDLVGITLELFGPNPQGIKTLLAVGSHVGRTNLPSGANQPVDPANDPTIPGRNEPEGWLVLPHGSTTDPISSADVQQIINQGNAEANLVRAQIRLPLGNRTRMVFAVADRAGNVLGLYRMPDATVFSIDVATAKARNTAYYADPTQLVAADRVDDNRDGVADLATGIAFSNRTFRFLAEPRFPSGVDGSIPGSFSILRDPGINRFNAENLGPALPASVYNTVLGFDAFHPGRNFHNPNNIANQNGIVFFPGSTPLYKNNVLVGGFGVSGDGVDQDDVVTFYGARGFEAPFGKRVDNFFVRGVRLPFQKFPRNPLA